MTDLRYPIGKFSFPQTVSRSERKQWIDDLAAAPTHLRAAVAGLTEAQLDTPYRPGGWTVRQVVHHLPDSHLNSYVRFKLALTEAEPRIKPYDEAAWAGLIDSQITPVETSLKMFEALHDRWVRLLGAMDDDAYARAFEHPESGKIRLEQNLALYAWHSKHHVAHITNLRKVT